jgi:hypothetical protein
MSRAILAFLLGALAACRPEPLPRVALPASEPTASEPGPTGLLRWTPRAKLPPQHPQACDLASTPAGLFVAASTHALEENGAGLYRLSKGAPEAVLRWNGQGFLRVHSYGERLFVPDADAPFGAAFFVRFDVDGYVFTLDPTHPERYTREVIPAVYHVFDTALLEGRVYASSGAYVPGDMPYRASRAPAALFVAEAPGKPWRRILTLPEVAKGTETGVVRFTFLQALDKGALLAGLTDWSATQGGDGAMRIEGLPDAPRAERVQGLPGEVVRWARWRGNVFAITSVWGQKMLYISHDEGRSFSALSPVSDGNRLTDPQSMVATENALYVLADGFLFRSQDGETFTRLTEANQALRGGNHPLVTAPLVLHEGTLWAASPTTGDIFAALPIE